MRGAAIVTAMSLAGCAYVGEPLPPALHIPTKIEDLRAIQRGGKILVEFTPPAQSTDGIPVALSATEIEIDGAPGAREMEAAPYVGREVNIRARTASKRGRFSEWSNTVSLAVIAPLEKPTPRVVARPDGVELSWTGGRARIRRGEEILGESDPPYLDRTAEYGKEYRYAVQLAQGSAESEVSEFTAILYRDTFPPAPPSQLTAIAGVGSIELAWERPADDDLAAYRVYRDGRLLAEKLVAATYSDKAVESGRTYRYEVAAIDTQGNESARSAAQEVKLP
jgi:hypothetical protein